ncbi:MAG TPA: hypothetical protein VGR08_12910 [Thermomicrobiales bacterium]|nr:hypothetical protein [Thermomicrobiales bacterium]
MTDKKRRRGHNKGSIYQTKEGTWRGALSIGWSADGTQRRKYMSGKSRAEVNRKITKLLHEQQRGMPIAGASPTVEQFLER